VPRRMRRRGWREVEEAVRSYLSLGPRLVGVKIRREGVIEGELLFKPERPMAYCHMVRLSASQGKTFVYDMSDEDCPHAVVVLGFQGARNGEEWRVEPPETRSLLIAPLGEMEVEPDVVLAVLNPRQMMDLTVLLQAGHQTSLPVGFRGEVACAEFTAKPYMEQKPNVSFLCNGSRIVYSDYRENELIFGAPPRYYAEAAEAVERVERTGGSLCGCRVTDVPPGIIQQLERAGLSKGTDYFFGKVEDRNVRLYLNKDFKGGLNYITVHMPMKLSSEEEAEETVKRLRGRLRKPYSAGQRGYWVDLTLTASARELSIDLLNGESVRTAVQAFVHRISQDLSRMGIGA